MALTCAIIVCVVVEVVWFLSVVVFVHIHFVLLWMKGSRVRGGFWVREYIYMHLRCACVCCFSQGWSVGQRQPARAFNSACNETAISLSGQMQRGFFMPCESSVHLSMHNASNGEAPQFAVERGDAQLALELDHLDHLLHAVHILARGPCLSSSLHHSIIFASMASGAG